MEQLSRISNSCGGGGGGGGGASQITAVSSVDPTVCSGADKRKHQSSVSLAFVRGIHRGPVNSPHKGPVTRKTFPFDDVIMLRSNSVTIAPCTSVNYSDVIMSVIASQITSLTIVYSCVNSSGDQRKHQSSASLIQAEIKENIKAPRHWPLWGEFTGNSPGIPPALLHYDDYYLHDDYMHCVSYAVIEKAGNNLQMKSGIVDELRNNTILGRKQWLTASYALMKCFTRG